MDAGQLALLTGAVSLVVAGVSNTVALIHGMAGADPLAVPSPLEREYQRRADAYLESPPHTR